MTGTFAFGVFTSLATKPTVHPRHEPIAHPSLKSSGNGILIATRPFESQNDSFMPPTKLRGAPAKTEPVVPTRIPAPF